MKVFSLWFWSNSNQSRTKFDTYASREAARDGLRKKRNAMVGVQIHDETEDSFSFTFGWEEKGGTWKIEEVEVQV